LGAGVPLARLVADLGGHPNATRAHLEALVADGHASVAPLPRSGPGRPAMGYTLTAEGRAALSGDRVASAYAELVSAMAGHLAQFPNATDLARSIGRDWATGRTRAPSRPAMLALLGELGFAPDDDGGVVRLRTCPILSAAAQHPEIVCAIHAGLVEGSSGSTDVRLEPFVEPGACRIEFAPAPEARTTP
ncbi:helix-turn-helix transcriptional regulator, partial [Kribbia dieselivorans]|uniref:helix-turn-helix transcriptional regulator n=1 Tax=Kribbia dieselivorans TaxID=331526 RepID=UPI000837BDE0